mgnify:CR=1 FL=1
MDLEDAYVCRPPVSIQGKLNGPPKNKGSAVVALQGFVAAEVRLSL